MAKTLFLNRYKASKRVCGITYSCPRCGRPFLTEAQMAVHYLNCGS